MPQTITSFPTFSPNTKARSSEVNTNFSNFRGSIIPIEENTAAASNLDHDLGAVDHWFRSGYMVRLFLGGSTSGWYFDPTTTGYLNLGFNSLNAFQFGYETSTGYGLFNSPVKFATATAFGGNIGLGTGSSFVFRDVGSDVTVQASNGALNIAFSTGDVSLGPFGILSSKRYLGWTASSSEYGIAGKSANINTTASINATGAAINITGSTVSMAYTNRPIMFCLTQNDDTVSAGAILDGSGAPITVDAVSILLEGSTITTVEGYGLGSIMFWRAPSSSGLTALSFSLVMRHTSTTGPLLEDLSLYVMEL